MQSTIAELFSIFGYDYKKIEYNKPIDVSNKNMQILSYDFATNKNIWSDITKIVKKDDDFEYELIIDNKKILSVSPFHFFYAKINNSLPCWIEAFAMIDIEKIELLDENNEWKIAKIKNTGKIINILDIEVDKTNCYFSNGFLSHNTFYGDPLITPGGKAIPYTASVRVRLTRGQVEKEKNENNDESACGVNTTAKVIKNRLGPPLRVCKFFISFANGIEDIDSWFDYLHQNGEIEKAASWCYLTTYPSGKVIDGKDRGFQFRESNWKNVVLSDEKLKAHIIKLLNKHLIIKYGQPIKDQEINPDSLMDNQSVIEQLNS